MPVPLGRAAAQRVGEPLPPMLEGLAKSRYRVRLDRGQLAMLAGPPSAGKTALALIIALRMRVPTLYVAADSDETVMAARVAAALTGHDVATVIQAVERGLYDEMYGDLVAPFPIRFMFDPSEPSMEDVSHALTAWLELWGDYPQLVIIDNLLNMRGENAGDEWGSLRRVQKDLHWMGRKTRAAVLALHHTSEGEVFDKAPPRTSIQGKIAQLPALIMTVGQDNGEMWIGIVKQRNGRTDAKAKDPIRMIVDFSRMRLWDIPMGEPVHLEQ